MGSDAATVQDVARCLGCGYALRGLSDRRCPECGRPFDPDDRRTVRLPAALRPRRAPAVIHAAADAGLIALGLTTVGRWMGAQGAVDLGWLTWVLLAALLVGQRVGGVLDWVAGPATPAAAAAARRSRRSAVGCLALAVVCNGRVTWGACPHSRWFILGPVGVCHSPNGMCHNGGSPDGGMPVGGGWYVIGPPDPAHGW